MRSSLAAIVMFVLSLIGCTGGLHPMYSNRYHNTIHYNLCSIKIEPMQSMTGANFLYHFVMSMPYCSGTEKQQYLLRVQIVDETTPSIIEKNADIARDTLVQQVIYKLYRINDNQEEEITTGMLSNTSSHQSISAYIDYITHEVALENLTKHTAEELVERLALFFNSASQNETVSNTN